MYASHYFLLLKPVAFTSHRTQEDIDGCSYQGWQVDNQQYSYKLVANLVLLRDWHSTQVKHALARTFYGTRFWPVLRLVNV